LREKMATKNSTDIVAGIVLILIGTGAIIGAIGLRIGTPTEPQPGFFPFLSGVAILVLSLIILVQGWLGRKESGTRFGEIWRPAMLIAVLILFVGLLEPLGYVIASAIVVVLALLIMGIKSWRVLLVVGLAFPIGTFILFDRLLGIGLPVGILARFGS
jgi:putative tricarboxylic transport membrane protein